MKRILALMLTLTMLLSMVAVAETADASQSALITNLTGVTIDITNEGETQHLEMGDLGVSCVVDTEDTLRLVLTADKGDEILTFAVAEIVDGKLRVGFKGVDRAFEQEIPEVPGMDMSDLAAAIRPLLPALMGNRVPEIKIPTLPKVDLAGLVGMMGSESTEADGVTTTTVDIPAETISMLLGMFVQIAQGAVESIPQGKQVVDLLSQLLDSGFSFAIKGTITDNVAEQSANIGIYMASEGETATDPTLYLNSSSAENNLVLAVDLPSDDSSYTIGQLTVVTDPKANTLDAGLDFAGMASLALKIHEHDELQCIDLTLQAPGTDSQSTMEFGRKDDQDYYLFKAQMGEENGYSCEVTGNPIDNGYAGTLAFNSVGSASGVDFNGSYYELLGDFDMAATLDGYELPTEAVAFSEMTSDEINTAFAPIQEAIQSVMGALAPAEEAPVEEVPAA